MQDTYPARRFRTLSTPHFAIYFHQDEDRLAGRLAAIAEETWEELRANVIEATSLHFESSSARPRLVQLHYVKDELIPVEAA